MEAAIIGRDSEKQTLQRLSFLINISPDLLLFGAMMSLRAHGLTLLHVSFGQALDYGLVIGVAFDVGFLFLARAIFCFFDAIVIKSGRFAWALCTFMVWFSALANILYYTFFGGLLKWWVVKLHWQDVALIGDSASDLMSLSPLLVASCVLFIGSLILMLRPRRHRSTGFFSRFLSLILSNGRQRGCPKGCQSESKASYVRSFLSRRC